ncbi:spore germination protein [Thermoanaerobacter kivui]|uniref:Spore germination protein n=1 Tax=Thermoanaerobacter kivui TaxID=2325 RepID=A0A097ATX4_THEKI|nr:endospore germination permease [Thermoanaerobacter kivui]AIS53255.1 spore germination protein [Thermoanaerobacter kivui]
MFKRTEQLERTSEKKISTKQLIFLLVTTVLSTADVFLPSYVALAAKQDSWISVLIAFVISVAIFVFYYKLAMLFKENTLFSYVDKIAGKFIGKIIAILYLLFLLHGISLVMRELIEIIANAFMPHTPSIVFYIVLMIAVMYTVSKGFLAIVKLNEMLFPFGMLLLAFVITLSIPKVDMSNFLPILENGIKPPIIGAIPILSFTLESVIILLIFPHISEKQKALKGSIISHGILAFSLILGVLAIGIFGAKTASNFQFTALEMVRNMRISDYIQRFDSLVMALWIMGIYLKIVIFTYLFAKGLAETINSVDYRFILLPLATLLIPLAQNVSESLDGLYTYIQRYFPFEAFWFEVFFPITLYIIAKIRKIK